jgi:hypothetical protein
LQELVDELATYFLVHGFEWKFDYGMAVPNEDDLTRAIEHAKKVLDSEEAENAQLELGRLVFKKRAGVIDVFVLAGTLED